MRERREIELRIDRRRRQPEWPIEKACSDHAQTVQMPTGYNRHPTRSAELNPPRAVHNRELCLKAQFPVIRLEVMMYKPTHPTFIKHAVRRRKKFICISKILSYDDIA